MLYEEKQIETIPVGPLGLIPLKSCEDLGKKVAYLEERWKRHLSVNMVRPRLWSIRHHRYLPAYQKIRSAG